MLFLKVFVFGKIGAPENLENSKSRLSQELLFNRYRVSVWDDKKALEMGCGDDCRTM